MTRNRQLGFTLLEVLLVALLMGLSAMAVTLTLNNTGPKQVVNKLAKQFLATTEMVLDQAVLSGTFIGIVIDDNKYQFVYYEDKKWQPIKLDRIATEKELDDGITMSLELDGMPLVQDDEKDDSLFDEPFVEAKSVEDKKKELKPQILLFPSGELTPFELSFIIKEQNKDVIVEVSGDAMGRVKLGRFDDLD